MPTFKNIDHAGDLPEAVKGSSKIDDLIEAIQGISLKVTVPASETRVDAKIKNSLDQQTVLISLLLADILLKIWSLYQGGSFDP